MCLTELKLQPRTIIRSGEKPSRHKLRPFITSCSFYLGTQTVRLCALDTAFVLLLIFLKTTQEQYIHTVRVTQQAACAGGTTSPPPGALVGEGTSLGAGYQGHAISIFFTGEQDRRARRSPLVEGMLARNWRSGSSRTEASEGLYGSSPGTTSEGLHGSSPGMISQSDRRAAGD